jgi:amidohydrolase
MIAAMAVGAAMALSRVADDVGLSVSVIGTPAEENGGGKILLLRRGAFHGVHAAMMVHPAPLDAVEPAMLAWSQFDAHFTGRASHASVFPELGINAADALVVTQTAIGLLRQHVPQTCRIHGIVTAAGEAPNVIPANASARYIVRAETAAELEDIKAKVIRCFEAGALATGASLDVRPVGPDYAELTHNGAIAARYRLNAEALGRVFPDLGPLRARAAGSTDMGNVSKMIPTIHPTIGIGSLPAINHQAEFAAQCVTQVADDAIVDGALAMAWTAIDIALDRTLCSALLAGGGPAATRS